MRGRRREHPRSGTRRAVAEAERDRLREAYDALTREVELARRRLIVAKAERVDTTQLELEFAAKLARARLRRDELEREVGWLTIPKPLPTMPAINSVPATP